MATYDRPNTYGRLFVVDRRSKMQFIVDTGSDICVFPRRGLHERRPKSDFELSAANGTTINTFRYTHLDLDIDLRRDFPWRFIVGDVTKTIIGTDFLKFYGLLVDIGNQRLLDNTTKSIVCSPAHSSTAISSIKIPNGDSRYDQILKDFPEITQPSGRQAEVKHRTVHFIRTTPGPLISCTPRRLAPDKLKIANTEFENMLKLGITRPSESS
ncbi:uncharacterized protein LOC131848527 [Achroia grisella]|uniref:uncharacterized protein LOC131848527 n=1 Tax=Achroia grisella TaxID=688607 RepID=UPI0027D25731|nr:uncharacterized protein LOC131848527 [Achroia grisella]